jgi:hypothetical protein
VPAAGESGQWGAAAGRSSNSRGNRAAVDAERGREEEGQAAGSEDVGQSIGEHLGPSDLQLPSPSPIRHGGQEEGTAQHHTSRTVRFVSLRGEPYLTLVVPVTGATRTSSFVALYSLRFKI